DGHPQAPEHAPERLAHVFGPAHLAVERGAPVWPEEEESKEGKHQEDRSQLKRAEIVLCVARFYAEVDRRLVRVAGGAEERGGLAIEGVLEVALAGEKQKPTNNDQADDSNPEADLLDAGVGLHAQRHHDADESQDDQAAHENAGLA